METELKMTLKEADRYSMMKPVESHEIPLTKASEEMGICYRQACRIWSRYQKEGPEGLISRRKGKPGNIRLPQERKRKIMDLVTHVTQE